MLKDGLGPMIFSPLSEMAIVGRNAPYLVTLFIYTMLWIGAATVNNLAGYLVLRFLTGFFGKSLQVEICYYLLTCTGSPALATGGATLSDIVCGPLYLNFNKSDPRSIH